MTTRHFNNTSPRDATLTANITATTLDLNVEPGLDDKMPDVPFSVRITDKDDLTNYELATCTAKPGGGILTVTRDYGGTTAIPRNVGDIVTAEATAEDFDLIYANATPLAVPQIFIASADASDAQKAAADYVCDGVDDDVQFQQAIDDLVALGPDINPIGSSVARYRWQIATSQGFFNLGNTITIPALPPPAPFTSTYLTLEFVGAGQANTLIGSVVEVTGPALISIEADPCQIDFRNLSLYRENLDLGWASLTTPIVKAANQSAVKVRMLNCIIEMF